MKRFPSDVPNVKNADSTDGPAAVEPARQRAQTAKLMERTPITNSNRGRAPVHAMFRRGEQRIPTKIMIQPSFAEATEGRPTPKKYDTTFVI
jgi:hypothetical protein